jgi:hypothetical protein
LAGLIIHKMYLNIARSVGVLQEGLGRYLSMFACASCSPLAQRRSRGKCGENRSSTMRAMPRCLCVGYVFAYECLGYRLRVEE